MKKSTFTIITIIIIILVGIGMYFLFFYQKNNTVEDINIDNTNNTPFSPLNRGSLPPTTNNNQGTSTRNNTATTSTNSVVSIKKLPKLRQLSTMPVAGMFASTTKIKIGNSATSTLEKTIVRYMDRGTGHIYEANDLNENIEKISNTTLPKIYEAYWNKNLNILNIRYLKDNTDVITNFYAEIRRTATSTASSTTPYEIKGKYISSNIKELAVSPTGDKIFTWNIENDTGIGYISSFDEKNKIRLVDIPLTQINVDWPEISTVTITTKGSSGSSGYSYAINTKNGQMTKILGGMRGLSTKTSKDAKNILYSVGGNTISSFILNIKTSSTTPIIFNTLADKCVWSTLRKNEVYCAVPNEIPEGIYPDDWYKGKISFSDKIWHLDILTGEVHLMGNLLVLANKLIDATDLTLDTKENYLYFINKNDLTLWVLDLNQ